MSPSADSAMTNAALIAVLNDWGNLLLVTGDRPWQVACREAAARIAAQQERIAEPENERLLSDELFRSRRDALQRAERAERERDEARAVRRLPIGADHD